jgi:hypothetical protein
MMKYADEASVFYTTDEEFELDEALQNVGKKVYLVGISIDSKERCVKEVKFV